MMLKGIDCVAKLNGNTASALKSLGYDYAIRYLGATNWKRFNKSEADAIQKHLKLVSVWEGGATHDSYFTYDKGKEDALFANQYAKRVGQPSGSAIYFAVDYECHNFNAVKTYFNGVKANLDKSFKVGIYGSYDVVNALKGYVDYYWQTYAWSHGKVAEHAHIYQYSNGQRVAGINVDLDKILKLPGAWNEPKKEVVKVEGPFKDVPKGHWAEGAIEKLKKAGIMRGYQDGTFGPDKNITRAEVAATIAKTLNYLGK